MLIPSGGRADKAAGEPADENTGEPATRTSVSPAQRTSASPAAKTSPRTSARAARSSAPGRPLPPETFSPELATLESSPPHGDGWVHEIKFDGYRILARIEKGKARLLSRNGKDWTARFPAVAREVARIPADRALLDGEVVALDASGRSSFQRLQGAIKMGDASLVYYAFDLLHLDGRDLTSSPLEQRKEALASLLSGTPPGGVVRFTDHTVGRGEEFFREACRHGLEGIVCKRRDSVYRSGRGHDWIKVKCVNRQEFVIGGYTDPQGSRNDLGALIVGVYDQGRLVYSGKVGTGFGASMLHDLKRRLSPLETSASPFEPVPRGLRGVHWVRPEVVAEIAFTEFTDDGMLRHPSFQGVREDKAPKEVRREGPGAPERPAEQNRSPGRKGGPMAGKERTRAPKKTGEDPEAVEVAGVKITHPEKVLFPEQGVTKLEVARYYEFVADRMLPLLVNRPMMLLRCPEGRHRQCFFQKHFAEGAPEHTAIVRLPEEKDEAAPYLVIRDVAGLIALVQLGALEIHVWGALADNVEKPDLLIFDLDPDPEIPWKKVTDAARGLRERLSRLDLPSFVKTTGGKGLHVVTPLARRSGWEEVRAFARGMVARMAEDDPETFTISASKRHRGGRIYLDYLRNGRGSTSIAAFSTRARPGAPVSVPVRWDELDSIRSDEFNVKNLPDRLRRRKRDPWEGFATSRVVLGKKALAGVATE